MDRKDKDKDIRERQERYQRGLVELCLSVKGFKELTGIDLTGDIDTAGRHIGEAPYLKITAERLAEVTALIEGEVDQASDLIDDLSVLLAGEATVISIDPKLRVESTATVLQFSAYRPATVKR